jgi:hypothetical protein
MTTNIPKSFPVQPLKVDGHTQDKTDYARAEGYTGAKRVLVSDGRVISHRSVCWFAFCAGLRQKSVGVVS